MGWASALTVSMIVLVVGIMMILFNVFDGVMPK
jgi:hypothetical protein